MKTACLAALLFAAVPLGAVRPAPRLLATAEDFARMEALAARAPWAAAVRTSIVQTAGRFPEAHNTRFSLSEWKLPPEGGQWTAHYVCPAHGVSLQTRSAVEHVCRIDNHVFSGWPYDQVIYSYRHSDNAAAARDNGLAYRFTGDVRYARAAARILLAYAGAYLRYPLKNTSGLVSSSAARAFAQTLDESVWLIPMAWAYDLVGDSAALTGEERLHIENDLLRAAVRVIQRNNAGVSNWQSWHNSAIGAVGFALEDADLIHAAIDGPAGFRFQMKNSVLADGVWYEGAWGYHFYALDALAQLAEMAARGGIDLWKEAPLRGMFQAPLGMAAPDLNLPAFNDSGPINLVNRDALYEYAWARWSDRAFAAVLGRRARGREALLWGAESVETASPATPASAVFPASGNAVLRAAASDHYAALKFGPHGEWHGHYDKLGFVSFARGAAMAVDPGTQSYAAPTHTTWDKTTVAHNTVVVDEGSQAEATGKLLAFAALPSISAVRASAGAAYKQASLERTLILTAEYAIDTVDAASLDGADHRFDWFYHNNGKLSTSLALAPWAGLPARNGYQHLSGVTSATTEADWKVDFDANDPTAAYGSVYASPSTVQARFLHSREQASSGAWSGRLEYDFTAAQGYVVYSTPILSVPNEAPSAISLMLYGDGSGHRLTLRLYDSTDERFTHTVGPVDWTGWREIRVADPARWGHYLGDEDGVIDTPIRTVAVEIASAAGPPSKGAMFVDEIRLGFAGGPQLAADFERTLRAMRLWMLGAEGTRVAAGSGLGPNLLQPVPFAMARRQGTAARFVSLLEPYGEAPRVRQFRASYPDSFTVAGDGFEDRVWFDAAGALRLVRRSAGGVTRAAVAGSAILVEGSTTWIETAQPASIQVDYRENGAVVEVTGDFSGPVRIHAPAAREAFWNGIAVKFSRDGDALIVARAGV